MSEIQFAGVKNTYGKPVKGMHGGIPWSFDTDEVKVLSAEKVQFLLSRNHIQSDGKIVTRKHLFTSIPLIEALKSVKEPENASIATAKKDADKETALRIKLTAEITAAVRAELKAATEGQGLKKP